MASVLPSNHELSLYQSISPAFLLFLPSSTGEWNEQEDVWVFGSWPGPTNIAFQQQLFLDVSCCQGGMTHQLPILLSLRCNLDILFWLIALLYLSIEKFSDRSSFQYCCCYCYVSWYSWKNEGQASYYFLTQGNKSKTRASLWVWCAESQIVGWQEEPLWSHHGSPGRVVTFTSTQGTEGTVWQCYLSPSWEIESPRAEQGGRCEPHTECCDLEAGGIRTLYWHHRQSLAFVPPEITRHSKEFLSLSKEMIYCCWGPLCKRKKTLP